MRRSLWVLLVVAALLLASCDAAMKPSTSQETPGGEVFMLAFPRLVIDIDQSGVPSMFGMRMKDVAFLIGQDLGGLQLDKYYVDWMTGANIQHIEMRQTGDRLALVVNGVAMPHVGWDDASLQQATDVAALFNVQGLDTIKKFMPIVRRLGVDVVVKFPLRPDAKSIPLADPSVAMTAAAPEQAAASTIVHFEVKYDANGVPAILGVSAQDLMALGMQNLPVALATQTIAALQARNFQYMELRTKPDGLSLYANGNPLPNLVWDNKLLSNAADLYAQMNAGSPYIDLVKEFLPALDNADVDVLVHFPLASGVTPIPVKTH